jgi:hypothetical protein
MNCTVPKPDHIGSETPIRLNVAEALSLPDRFMTALGRRGVTTDVIGRLYRRTRSNRAKAVLGS